MSAIALVPINRLTSAKSRLAGELAPDDRARLVLWLAGRVVGALRGSGTIARVAVVSPDPLVLGWATAQGVAAVAQSGAGLCPGLDEARRWALEAGASTLVVALADLPWLTAEDVTTLARAVEGAPGAAAVALAPDRARAGTNLLALRPPALLPFVYGPGSFTRFRALARARGVEPRIVRSASAALDVDAPADVRALIASGTWRPIYPAAGGLTDDVVPLR